MRETTEIQTTLGALADAEGALIAVSSLRLPAKASYHLSKLVDLVRDELRHFHEQRNALVTELGVEREPTGAERAANGPSKVVEVTAGNRPQFFARVAEIAAVPVTIRWTPFDLAGFGDREVTPADLSALRRAGLVITSEEGAPL